MQVTTEKLGPTTHKLTLVADQQLLDNAKAKVLEHLARGHVKVQGFRQGKVPKELVEKNVDQNLLQSEFLEQAVNQLYGQAVDEQRLRPVEQPKINITKFVPFTTLEVTAEVEAVGDIKLPDYKRIKLAKPAASVTPKDVDDVMKNLRQRAAAKQEVKREAKAGDEVVIDFTGVDAKTKEPVAGADGKDYPLLLGSNTFIPGFEDNVVGMKPGEAKEFDITFPKDYGVKPLQNHKVTFTVTVGKVQTVTEPKLDDAFAATVGPFKTLAELKADVKKQLQNDKQQEAERRYENELLQKIAEKSDVAIPKALVDEEIERIEDQERQNVVYRGQTWQEHLDQEGLTAEAHKEKNRPQAELRVKGGLI
ncbi:MAG TPA: trigger factor, partial [Patescibacteria group bacterium]|nr:trigger factor [Patescibacteria group bacterium]